MFEYIDNKKLKIEIDKLLLDCDITKVELAKRLECKPQQVTNILNKKNFAFSDLQRILNALDCSLYIDIKKNNNKDV